MKVGIVSIYDNGNWGNRLQNYALQQILKKYADEVITIKNKSTSNSKLDRIARALGIADIPFVNSVLGKKKRAQMLKFTNRYINNSKKYYYHDQEYSYPVENCDMYCSGSDQVWNPNLKVTGSFHFLGFSKREKNFSFAASFGIDHIDDLKTRQLVVDGLKNFQHISVREAAGKKLIQEDLKVSQDVEVLIDPTLYFDAANWEKIEKRPASLTEEKYVLTYFLGGCSDSRFSKIKKVALEHGCIIIDLLDSTTSLYAEIGPSEFIYLIHHASLVCTDSFHASVFSFIFAKPLHIFNREGEKSNMGSRIATLVNKFGLHLVNNEDSELTITPPDYTKGYVELDKERRKVDEYLQMVFREQDASRKQEASSSKTKLYACYSTNDEIRKISSSGGIYYLLAKQIIHDGGVVYAASYDGLRVKHVRIEKEEEIKKTCGSKYVQSELGNTYKSIAADLELGRKVLFVGQPCQCNGLRQSFGQNDDLICVDFVCHGVPPKDIWQKYLDSMDKRGLTIRCVNMRNKSTGWKNFNWRIETEDGRILIEPKTKNVYMKGFLKNLYLKPICYRCKFKGIARHTDISLGDYWGIETAHPEMFDDKGVSLVMIHSEKGKELFSEIMPYLRLVETTAEKATKSNPNIIISPMRPREADVFIKRMERGEDFCKVVDELTRPNMFRDLATKVDRKIRRLKASK